MIEAKVQLPAELNDYLLEQIGHGRFADISDFVRTALRADRCALDRLDDCLQEGFESGISELSFEEIVDRAKGRARSRAA